MLNEEQKDRLVDLFENNLKSEKIEKHFEEIKKREELKNNNIINLLTNPQNLEIIILKLANTENQYIDNESFSYSKEQLPLTYEEFNMLYDTVQAFISLQGKLYDECSVNEEQYFPTNTGHMIINDMILTVREMYGQGTLSSIYIESMTEDNSLEDIIQTFNDNLIPYTDFESLKERGLDLFNRRKEIFAKLQAIHILEEARDKLEESININELSESTVKWLLSTKDSINNQIEEINKEIY